VGRKEYQVAVEFISDLADEQVVALRKLTSPD
jgi:hypothetical protein